MTNLTVTQRFQQLNNDPREVGIYETTRARKFINLFVRCDLNDDHPGKYELWFNERHLVGYFDWADVYRMVINWEQQGKDIRIKI